MKQMQYFLRMYCGYIKKYCNGQFAMLSSGTENWTFTAMTAVSGNQHSCHCMQEVPIFITNLSWL